MKMSSSINQCLNSLTTDGRETELVINKYVDGWNVWNVWILFPITSCMDIQLISILMQHSDRKIENISKCKTILNFHIHKNEWIIAFTVLQILELSIRIDLSASLQFHFLILPSYLEFFILPVWQIHCIMAYICRHTKKKNWIFSWKIKQILFILC